MAPSIGPDSSGRNEEAPRSGPKGYPRPPAQDFVTASPPAEEAAEDQPRHRTHEFKRPKGDDDLAAMYGGPHGYHAPAQPKASNRQSGDDLANIYISKDTIPVLHSSEFTVKEGPPPPETRDWGGVIRGGLILLLALGLFMAATLVRVGMVDPDGRDIQPPLYQWAWYQVVMSHQQREIQSVAAEDRPYVLTRLRIRTVYDAAQRHELHEGSLPDDVVDLVLKGYIAPERSVDGWGGRFVIEGRGNTMTVRSYGADGIPNTSADVVMSDNGLAVPASWADRIY